MNIHYKIKYCMKKNIKAYTLTSTTEPKGNRTIPSI